jgi:diguanylate cyclase (GGDEF)-like protein/PAS domain S-box-containing protein
MRPPPETVEGLARELRDSERRFRAVLDSTAAAVVVLQDDRVVAANRNASGLTGYTQAELLGMDLWRVVHPDFQDALRQRAAARLQGQPAPPRYELKLVTAGGEERWVDVTAAVLPWDGRPALLGMAFDVTERKLAELAMRETERRLRDVLENVQLASVLVDREGLVTFANPYLLELLGGAEEDVVGRDWFELCVPLEDRDRSRAAFARGMESGLLAPHEDEELLTLYGERRLLSWNHTLLHDLSGVVNGRASIGADVTERRRAEQQLQHNAFHDGITGLPNRALFMDRLGGALLRQRRRPEQRCAVLFVNLDRFKLVNESLGHAAGDRLLVEMASVLRRIARPGDTVARLGGDEFAVLVEDLEDRDDVERTAAALEDALGSPFTLGTQDVFVTATSGIAVSDEGYERAEDALRDAHTAMRHRKTHAPGSHQVFDRSMHSTALRTLELENDLRRAVEREEFLLHYQPIVELATGRIAAFEALVRWEHPQHGLVSPLEFIHLAEETGLIFAIGRWALREACREMADLLRDSPPDVTVNVNLSSRQFSRPDLAEQIQDALRESGLPAQRLKLEITESVIMENAESAIMVLRRLKDLGASVGIDDFGTGYSSLSYLLRFPADTLKIDRSFLWAMGDGGRNAQIVRTIVVLAHGLQMTVVAEGVETENQRRQLLALDCRYGQGYLFSRPVDGDRARAMLADEAARSREASSGKA